jgi:hypothetical protein
MQYRLLPPWLRFKHVLIGGLCLRVAALLAVVNPAQVNFWEYGEIAGHLLKGHGFAYSFVDEIGALSAAYYPSALMPPGYVFFLLPFMILPAVEWQVYSLFLVQIALSGVVTWLIYRLSVVQFDPQVGLLAASLYALFPEMIYATLTVGPTIWFHLGVVAMLYIRVQQQNYPYAWLWQALLAAVLVYMRTEFLLVAGLWFLWDVVSTRSLKSVWSGLLLLFILSPWVWRNYQVFGKPVFTNNLGINLYRGHNPDGIGHWGARHAALFMQLQQEKGAQFEPAYNQAWKEMAIDYMVNNPAETLKNAGIKWLRFFLFDWSDSRSFHWLYWLPWLLALAFGLLGVFKNGMTIDHKILFFAYSLVVMVFFAQTRYQTMVKPLFLMYAAFGVFWLSAKWRA